MRLLERMCSRMPDYAEYAERCVKVAAQRGKERNDAINEFRFHRYQTLSQPKANQFC